MSRQLMVPTADTELYTVRRGGKQKVRTQFRRLGWIMRIPAGFGRSARMSPAEAASPRSRMSSTRLPDRRSK
jgi:hypothetical protein